MIVTCKKCGDRDDSFYMNKVNSPSRKYFYVCNYCAGKEENYSTPNNTRRGKQAAHGLTYGIEMETSERNIEDNILYQYDFIPTSDCSIGGTEWKSPIYGSLSGLRKLFRTLEKILVIDEDCGTHLNIGTFSSDEMEYIRRFYHSLFIPLCEVMMYDYPEDTKRLFGRFFTGYAGKIDKNTDPCAHSNFINVASDNRIEFRLCKFEDADQYLTLMKMHTEFVKAIKNNFLSHFNDDEIDNGIKNIRNYRIHKANIAANKMVKIFKKYAAK